MILDILFPRICSGCGSSGAYLCPTCKKSLHPHPEICPLTHKPSPGYAVRQDLLTIPSPLDGCIVLFRFEPLIKKLILGLKYSHRRDIASFLGERLALALQGHEILGDGLLRSFLQEDFLQGAQGQFKIQNSKFLISYVPSHRIRKYITKGYNQSELLAQSLSLSLPLVRGVGGILCKQICKKTKHTHSQVGMSRNERKNNLTDAFEVTTQIPAGSTIIIVDDVLTSGATMIEMAKTIKKSQPDCQVWGLCVARNG